MVLQQTVAGRRRGEDSADLESWLTQLKDCPAISQTVVMSCPNAKHADEPGRWFYVEADARESVARRRCLSCGDTVHVLDSADHWNFVHMWSCPGCSASIAEIGVGLHADDGDEISWVVLAARCVECGTIDGLTDFSIDPMPAAEVLARV